MGCSIWAEYNSRHLNATKNYINTIMFSVKFCVTVMGSCPVEEWHFSKVYLPSQEETLLIYK